MDTNRYRRRRLFETANNSEALNDIKATCTGMKACIRKYANSKANTNAKNDMLKAVADIEADLRSIVKNKKINESAPTGNEIERMYELFRTGDYRDALIQRTKSSGKHAYQVRIGVPGDFNEDFIDIVTAMGETIDIDALPHCEQWKKKFDSWEYNFNNQYKFKFTTPPPAPLKWFADKEAAINLAKTASEEFSCFTYVTDEMTNPLKFFFAGDELDEEGLAPIKQENSNAVIPKIDLRMVRRMQALFHEGDCDDEEAEDYMDQGEHMYQVCIGTPDELGYNDAVEEMGYELGIDAIDRCEKWDKKFNDFIQKYSHDTSKKVSWGYVDKIKNWFGDEADAIEFAKKISKELVCFTYVLEKYDPEYFYFNGVDLDTV